MARGDKLVLQFIQDATWESLPPAVKEQSVKCVIDLVGALAAGTLAVTSAIMKKMVCECFPGDSASIILSGRKASLPGAALANGFSMNALDVDDGHRMIKGHPGAAVFPALVAAGEYKGATLKELLTTLVVCYEVAIRAGLALHRHYGFYHGSGSWGAIGAAAGAARLLGLTGGQTLHAMGAAEYHGPLAPVMRPVAIPTMNKDGIGWGNMVGVMSALMAAQGYTGSPSVLDYPEFDSLTETLGLDYRIMELYFKPYTCCRWAHPSVSAILELREKHGLRPDNVKNVRIRTFGAAASLYMKKPTNTEEAQYNVIYPVAAALAAGEVGPRQVLEAYLQNKEVLDLMDRISIVCDERFDREFPAKRLCEVEIELMDGSVLRSGIHGPVGEPDEPVSLAWILEKFHWLTADVLDRYRADKIISVLTGNPSSYTVPDLVGLFDCFASDGIQSVRRYHAFGT